VTRTVDPLGGSYFVEALTDEMEQRIAEIIDGVQARGGMVEAIESGYVQRIIADEAFGYSNDVAAGRRPIVGVNMFTSDDAAPEVQGYALDELGRERQLRRLAAVKADRSTVDVKAALSSLRSAADGDDNLMPVLIDAVQSMCTIGEIVGALKDVWGEYREPKVF
jgi:methylmalonyl-CoA mutase N-terminal domain/subunit